MEKVEEIYSEKIVDIDAKLDSIHQDIKRLMERSNKEYLELMLSNLKKDFLNSITSYVSDDRENCLESSMVDPCEMRETCKSRFTNFLANNENLFLQDNVPEDVIEEKKLELSEIRKGAPFDKCDICFSEVNSLFNKQLDLISSLQIYSTNKEKRTEISTIQEENIVKSVLEPLSNKQRLQILKSMASETRTFSALSESTGLRGGNLLFHIQKLLETDLILQRHERGDYMITKKGFNLLMMLANFQKLQYNE
ncbi:winged helix-turn-helix domain-containing protein [Methanobacterium spitsbergense]|uniref:Winged helix-turn-helix domain-containing protein n=1 Tax=Methanobacterium spitsbergense TaxID=2874285 RepID=A0A8T5UL12_9EURY|nr:winged helix-turn-helix domain-containing protein [Methanobacterium spitsbergense]MBZ2164522.1 winged helix-turn-helix domain-containing protein [Methanobacterium spitsbergense]